MLRRRNVTIKTVKELDAFPKVTETCTDKSAVGGTFSVVTFLVIALFILSEISYFLDSNLMFKFEPDTDIDAKLKLNIDITVAMRCLSVGADILDATNQNIGDTQGLVAEDTWWDLDPDQKSELRSLRDINSYFRKEHAIQKYLWKSSQFPIFTKLRERKTDPDYPHDACRIHGTLEVNKVAGNFHITAGKSLSLPHGHVHISAYMTYRDYNFTHRINHFSFGDITRRVIHPLDGDEKIAGDPMMLYQYFIEVVPTEVDTLLHQSKTFQFSVKDHERPINHDKGSHGMPGIFFKYDTSALKVKVSEKRERFISFLIRLCASTGGIFVTSGLINSVVQAFWYIVCCKFFKSPQSKDDHKVVVSKASVTGTDMGPVNLVNIPTPSAVDVTLLAP